MNINEFFTLEEGTPRKKRKRGISLNYKYSKFYNTYNIFFFFNRSKKFNLIILLFQQYFT